MASIELLLRAAVGRGESATAAWEAWLRANDLARLEPAELRLLPAAYRNLREQGLDESRIPAIARQMTRTAWVRTRLLVREAAAAADLLERNGIAAMLLKGAALVAAGDLEAGLRPMSDFDLLVHPADAIRAAAILESAGWRSERSLTTARVRHLHASSWKKGDSVCDLHWRVAWETNDEADDERFWRAAEIVETDGLRVRVPSLAHQLLHTIVHGTRRVDKTTVRWLPDSMAVLRSRRTLDWDAFRAETKARRLEFPVGEALAYLAELSGADIPQPLIDELRARRATRAERRIYMPRRDDAEVSAFAFPVAVYYRSMRQARGGVLARVLWLPRTLQHTWNLRRLHHVPIEIVRRITRRIRRRIA